MSVFTSSTASLPIHITHPIVNAYLTCNRTRQKTVRCSLIIYSFRMLPRFLRIAFPFHSWIETSIPMMQLSRALPQTYASIRFFGKKSAPWAIAWILAGGKGKKDKPSQESVVIPTLDFKAIREDMDISRKSNGLLRSLSTTCFCVSEQLLLQNSGFALRSQDDRPNEGGHWFECGSFEYHCSSCCENTNFLRGDPVWSLCIIYYCS